MKRITATQITYIANSILNEMDLHFQTQRVLSSVTNRKFEFWKVKEVDILIEFNHYCNIKDLTFCDDDIKKYHEILLQLTDNYKFDCLIKNIKTAIFYIK